MSMKASVTLSAKFERSPDGLVSPDPITDLRLLNSILMMAL